MLIQFRNMHPGKANSLVDRVSQRWASLIKKLMSFIVNPLTKNLASLTVNSSEM